jgi:hypothetical protein
MLKLFIFNTPLSRSFWIVIHCKSIICTQRCLFVKIQYIKILRSILHLMAKNLTIYEPSLKSIFIAKLFVNENF